LSATGAPCLAPGDGLVFFFRGRLRGGLLRRDHVIKLCVDAVELALQLVDRGVGGGLLRRQMPHRDLLPVTVAKRQSRHDQ